MGSIIPLLLLLGLSYLEHLPISFNAAVAIGLVLLFVMVASAVSFFIKSNKYKTKFSVFEEEELELEYGVKSIIKKLATNFISTYYVRVSISIMLFVVCPVPLIVVSIFSDSNFGVMMMVIVLILILAAGIFIIIPVSAENDAYNILLEEGNYSPKNRQSTKRIMKVAAIYWPIITAVYLGWSLWTMDWGRTWIVWPVSSVLFAALAGFMEMLRTNEK